MLNEFAADIATGSLYFSRDFSVIGRERYPSVMHETLAYANEEGLAAQERLGHSTIKTTLDLYSHATPTMQEQAVNALDERFGRRGA